MTSSHSRDSTVRKAVKQAAGGWGSKNGQDIKTGQTVHFSAIIFLSSHRPRRSPSRLAPGLIELLGPTACFDQRFARLQQALEARQDVRPAARYGLDERRIGHVALMDYR